MGLLLVGGELCVCDVEGALEISQSKSSRHLRTLLHAGLVTNRRQGTWMHYQIPKDKDQIRKIIVQTLEKTFSPEKLKDLKDRLSRWLEKKDRCDAVCTGS